MSIAVIGSGYVGLVTAAVFARYGHQVTGVDTDSSRIAQLRQGHLPIYEPGLTELVVEHLASGRLSFTTNLAEALMDTALIFITVGTPPAADGMPDLSQVMSVAAALADTVTVGHYTVVTKSTVPVGTGCLLQQYFDTHAAPRTSFTVLANPEFLREGSALADALSPNRIIIGAPCPEAAEPLLALYETSDHPLYVTDNTSAEMIKYASNAFLATKLSFINTIAELCERSGADVRRVADGMGADPRIGSLFLTPGIGYGGSCLPKDVQALRHLAETLGCDPSMFAMVHAVNEQQVDRMVARMSDTLGGLAGKSIAVLGLTFKEHTDDLRESRSLALCKGLRALGATVHVHDPVAMLQIETHYPDLCGFSTPLAAASGTDAVVVATAWQEYRALELQSLRLVMRGRLFVDAGIAFEPQRITDAGLEYLGVGTRHEALLCAAGSGQNA